jgi:putative photosynthetic complex assembly protein
MNTASPIFPHKPMIAVFAALAMLVVVVGGMRLSGFEAQSLKPTVAPDETLVLKVEDGNEGRVVVSDVESGRVIKTFHRGEGSFLRATFRALVNDRKRKGASMQEDFRLERHEAESGNQFYLIDGATGRAISLNAFGPTNTAVFAALMSNQKGEGL